MYHLIVMEPSVLRPARESEAGVCADLVILSAPEFFSYVYGDTGEALRSLFMEFFNTPGTPYTREHIVVDATGDTVRGLILAFPVAKERRFLKQEIRVLRRRSGGVVRSLTFLAGMVGRIVRGIRYPRLNRDELFISNLAVFPEFRGQGIARRLLETGLARARDMGLSRVVLFVETDNLRAQQVYESFGFRKSGKTTPPRRLGRREGYGFFRMDIPAG